MPCLWVAAHNVRGPMAGGDVPARVARFVCLWVVELHLDVVLLQEKRLNSASEGRAETQLMVAASQLQVAPYVTLFLASSTSGNGGTAILVSQCLSVGGSSCLLSSLSWEPAGRLLGIQCEGGGGPSWP